MCHEGDIRHASGGPNRGLNKGGVSGPELQPVRPEEQFFTRASHDAVSSRSGPKATRGGRGARGAQSYIATRWINYYNETIFLARGPNTKAPSAPCTVFFDALSFLPSGLAAGALTRYGDIITCIGDVTIYLVLKRMRHGPIWRQY
jgi:hypothetical protein